MKEKDITEKTLESYSDVFADIVNVVMFGGERVVAEEDLEDSATFSSYKVDGRLRSQERDVFKLWKKSMLKLMLVGIENQTTISRYMPLRVIGYDGAAYRDQVPERGQGKKGERNSIKSYQIGRNLYPVITIVLYFGGQRHWKPKMRSLGGVLTFPKEYKDQLRSWFSDYRINVVEVAYLTMEQVGMFQSDFRIVAEYFVKSRTDPDYVPEDYAIKHVNALFNLLSVMTGDRRFEEAANYVNKKSSGGEGSDASEGEQEVVTMRSQFIDNIWKKAKEEGEKIGKEKGERLGEKRGERRGERRGVRKGRLITLRQSYNNMLDKTDYSKDEIWDLIGATEEERRELEPSLN